MFSCKCNFCAFFKGKKIKIYSLRIKNEGSGHRVSPEVYLHNEIEKQPPKVFFKKGLLKNLSKLTGKHLRRSLFFNRVTSGTPFQARNQEYFRAWEVSWNMFTSISVSGTFSQNQGTFLQNQGTFLLIQKRAGETSVRVFSCRFAACF